MPCLPLHTDHRVINPLIPDPPISPAPSTPVTNHLREVPLSHHPSPHLHLHHHVGTATISTVHRSLPSLPHLRTPPSNPSQPPTTLLPPTDHGSPFHRHHPTYGSLPFHPSHTRYGSPHNSITHDPLYAQALTSHRTYNTAQQSLHPTVHLTHHLPTAASFTLHPPRQPFITVTPDHHGSPIHRHHLSYQPHHLTAAPNSLLNHPTSLPRILSTVTLHTPTGSPHPPLTTYRPLTGTPHFFTVSPHLNTGTPSPVHHLSTLSRGQPAHPRHPPNPRKLPPHTTHPTVLTPPMALIPLPSSPPHAQHLDSQTHYRSPIH
nr:extensin-like [Penaeus vannamei]